jgi:hypothetical protein
MVKMASTFTNCYIKNQYNAETECKIVKKEKTAIHQLFRIEIMILTGVNNLNHSE